MARAKDPRRAQEQSAADPEDLNTGKPYEIAAVEFFRKRYGDRYRIQHDVKLPNDDGGLEQIDILIELPALGTDTFQTAVEAKDHGRALGKDAVRAIHARFQAANVHSGVIVCAKGLSSGGETALNKARNPRIELHVKTREELIEGAWGSDFLDALPALRDAKAESAPNTATIRRVVLAIETFPYYARYFFYENLNSNWVPILASEGVIDRAFSGRDTLLAREVGEYIARFAVEHPAQILEMSKAANDADQWTKSAIIEAALKIPKEVRRKVARNASEWNLNGFIFVDKVAELVCTLFRDEAIRDGLTLLSAVTKIRAKKISRDYALMQLYSPVDDYWFSEITRGLFPQLAEIDASSTLGYARKRLEEALRLEYPRLKGEMSTLVCHHVGIPGEFGPNGITEILVCAYRDALLHAACVNIDATIAELKTVFLERKCGGAVRCGLYTLAEHFAKLKPVLEIVLEEDDFWTKDDYLPELETMVESAWPDLIETERERILKRVLNLNPFDYGWSPEPEDLEMWRKGHQVQWLIRLEPLDWPTSLANEAQKMLNRLREETGITMLPDRGGVRTMFLDHEPDVAKNFGSMTSAQILAVCQALQPERDVFNNKTPYGAATKLREEVARRPDEFLKLPDEALTLPYPCYANALIDGLIEAVGRKAIKVKRAAEMAHLLLDRSNPQVHEDQSSDVGDPRWTRVAAARLIERAATNQHTQENDLPELLSLWLVIERQEAAADAVPFTHFRRNILETAMNSIDGSLSLALGALTIRSLHLGTDEAREEPSRRLAWETYEATRSLVETFILSSSRPHVRSPLGTWVTSFFLLDRMWLEAKVKDFFPADPVLWGAIWERCLDSSLSIEVFRWLRPQFKRGLELLRTAEGEHPQWAGSMARNLTIAWMMGELMETNDLFKRLLRDASPSALDDGAMIIQRRLAHAPEDVAEWARAILFWELVTRRKDHGGRSRERMTSWLRTAPDAVTLSLVEKPLMASLQSEREVLPDHTLQFVAKRASREPEIAARILLKIAETSWRWAMGDFVALMTEALRSCWEAGDSEVRLSVRATKVELLKRGYFQFAEEPHSSETQ